MVGSLPFQSPSTRVKVDFMGERVTVELARGTPHGRDKERWDRRLMPGNFCKQTFFLLGGATLLEVAVAIAVGAAVGMTLICSLL